MPNPYLGQLDDAVGELLAQDAEEYARSQLRGEHTHWDQDNEWVNTHLAGFAMAAAYAWQEPRSKWYRNSWLGEYAVDTLKLLVARGEDDRWWHRDGRKGDPNIDRFVLLPLMEASQWLRPIVPLDQWERTLARINGVLDRQLQEYGQAHDGLPYPNMDVYYCLLMLLGARLTERAECQAEYERFLGTMEQAQFAEGGWTYYRGTNECPVYHDIAVMLLARIWHLTGDERARTMVGRSVPYYPQVVDPTGRPEYFTDCWWKHYWASPQHAYGPDTVASLSGDAANRALGDLLRARPRPAGQPWDGQVELPSIVHAAVVWEEVATSIPWAGSPEPNRGGCAGRALESPPTALTPAPFCGVFYDANIEGPRGKFADWSWAATARHGSDTLVGAVVHTDAQEPPVALMAVTAEIEGRHEGQADHDMWRYALGITPPDTRGETTISDDRATFVASYPMAAFRGIWDGTLFPYQWQCRQSWELDVQRLVGNLTIVSQVEQESPPPQVRLRFGRNLSLAATGEGEYTCGPFRLRVASEDLPQQTLRAAQSVFCVVTRDAVELVLSLVAEPERYAAGQTFGVQINIEFTGSEPR